MTMKETTIASIFCLLLLTGCQPAPPSAEPVADKAVFIILDGIPADVVEKVATPTLDEIAQAGGYARSYVGGEKGAYSETPTISAPGYMDLITGTWANKHNVWDNGPDAVNYHYWNLFRIAENADSSLKTAIFSTWLDNRTVLVGEGQPGAGSFKLDYAFDGFEKDTLRYPHDDQSRYILNIDEAVSSEAGRYIGENAPDLSWVYLEYTDDMGHRHGDSDILFDAVQKADNQVKKIWDAIKKRPADKENWLIVITTDHGRDSISGRDHGGQSTRERTNWIVTNSNRLNRRFTQGQPAMTDIAPSILAHLGISAPEPIQTEMDGTSFIGDISFDGLRARMSGDTLHAQWRAWDKTGTARIAVAFANDFKTGGADTYETLLEAPLADEKADLILNAAQLDKFKQNRFLKISVQAPFNRGNYWITVPPPAEK